MQTLEIRVEQKMNHMGYMYVKWKISNCTTIFHNLVKMKRHILKPKKSRKDLLIKQLVVIIEIFFQRIDYHEPKKWKKSWNWRVII